MAAGDSTASTGDPGQPGAAGASLLQPPKSKAISSETEKQQSSPLEQRRLSKLSPGDHPLALSPRVVVGEKINKHSVGTRQRRSKRARLKGFLLHPFSSRVCSTSVLEFYFLLCLHFESLSCCHEINLQPEIVVGSSDDLSPMTKLPSRPLSRHPNRTNINQLQLKSNFNLEHS